MGTSSTRPSVPTSSGEWVSSLQLERHGDERRLAPQLGDESRDVEPPVLLGHPQRRQVNAEASRTHAGGPDRHPSLRRVMTQHLGGDSPQHHVSRELAAHDGPGRHDGVIPERRPGQDDHVGPEPAARTDRDRGDRRRLPADRLVGVLVGVVLVGDVDVGTGLDLVAQLDGPVPDQVRAATDDAAAPDLDDRRCQHRLAGPDPRGQADVGADQRLIADRQVSLVVDDPLGRQQRRSAPEVTELARVAIVGAHRGDLVEVAPGCANPCAEPAPPAQPVCHRGHASAGSLTARARIDDARSAYPRGRPPERRRDPSGDRAGHSRPAAWHAHPTRRGPVGVRRVRQPRRHCGYN